MRISVVIPHLNQPEHLHRCLQSLFVGQRKADEIFVIDNGSRELPEHVCKQFEGVTLLQEPTPGPGPARNLGATQSQGDVLAFIDADCLASPQWLQQVETTFAAQPDISVLGGDVRIARAAPDQVTVLEAYESIYAYRMDRYIAREGFTGTGNLAVRRATLETVGPFRGLDVAEDRDWGQRATGAGFQILYVPNMKVYHPARQSFAELQMKWDRHSSHDYGLYRARKMGRLKWTLRILAMIASPAYEVGRILASDRVQGAKERIYAAGGMVRIRLYRARIMLQLLIHNNPDEIAARWNR